MSLAACSGGIIGHLLRKTGKTISYIKVNAKGTRRDQHPTSFQKILLEFAVCSNDVKDADIQKAIKLAEESVCPVWAMVKGNAEIVTRCEIIASQKGVGKPAEKNPHAGRVIAISTEMLKNRLTAASS